MLLVDLNQDKSKENKYLSNTLLSEIDECLKEGKKVILYLNKRGEYTSLICSNCSFLYKCPNCDNSLSLHNDFMMCHICNYTRTIPINCDNCSNSGLQKVGVGTQQIEKFLVDRYKYEKPQNKTYNSLIKLENIPKILRFDADVIQNRSAKKKALELLKNTDIIIGTKMITTGFDFENVGLIGVILLEQELQIPRYDTTEKVYANLKQLLGRGGRKGMQTKFIIQTFIPQSEIVKNIVFSNYKEFFTSTLKERKFFNYPPFCEFVILEYRDKDKEKALNFILKIKEKLENELKNYIDYGCLVSQENDTKQIKGKNGSAIEIILNPNYSKKYNQFYYKIILKGQNLREFLKCIKTKIFRNSNFSVIFD